MLIQYKATRHKREVSRDCARRLIKAGIATKVTKPRAMKAKPIEHAGGATEPVSGQYERRDLSTEG